jgi:hypothetical protein
MSSLLHNGASHIPLIYHEGKLCVVLFSEPKYNIHMDSGGHAEINETPVDTAEREGREESLNTFVIEPEHLIKHINYYNISNLVVYKNYYAFFVKYNIDFNTILNVYSNNRDIIFKSENVPDHWKESNNVNIFPIESLINGQTNDNCYFWCKDIFDNYKIVHRRPIKYIINAIYQKIIYKKNDDWNFQYIPEKNIIIQENVTMNFLNGTKSIRVQE